MWTARDMHPRVLRGVSKHMPGMVPSLQHRSVPLLDEPLIDDHCPSQPTVLQQARRVMEDVAAVRRRLVLSPVWVLVLLSVVEAAIIAQGMHAACDSRITHIPTAQWAALPARFTRRWWTSKPQNSQPPLRGPPCSTLQKPASPP